MEFQEYVKQRNKMFNSIGRKDEYCACVDVDCDKCHDLTKESTCFEYIERSNPKQAEAIVQKWADEHPAITNAQMYEKIFGYKPIGNFGGSPCVPHLQSHNCNSRRCSDCKDWWGEEYEEPEKEVEE